MDWIHSAEDSAMAGHERQREIAGNDHAMEEEESDDDFSSVSASVVVNVAMVERRSSIESEPRTLHEHQLRNAREAAIDILTNCPNEAYNIFTQGLNAKQISPGQGQSVAVQAHELLLRAQNYSSASANKKKKKKKQRMKIKSSRSCQLCAELSFSVFEVSAILPASS